MNVLHSCRYLVEEARALGDIQIIDRCNLTVLCEPGQEDLPQFLAKHKVRVVASLPCYSQDNVEKQRGRGVFERSIDVSFAGLCNNTVMHAQDWKMHPRST